MQAKAKESTQSNFNASSIKRGPIVFALIIGAFVAILNETLLANALPDLMREFEVSASTIQWLTTAYMLVMGVLVPVTAVLQQWFTTRQMFLSAMILFLAGTVVSAAAPEFGFLLMGRVVQAMGTALMLPVLMNTILTIFPPEKRGGAMGLIGLVIMFAPAIGPTLSGLILDSLSWRWLFYLVMPLAAFSIAFAAKYLKNVTVPTKPKVDALSIVLSTIGFGGIVYGFSKAGEGSWSDQEVIWSMIAGGIGLLLFVWRQLRLEQPMMDLRAFKYPMFTLVAILLFTVFMVMFSTMTLLPMFLQGALLLTAFKSGLIMLPGGVVNGLMSVVSGKLFDKYGPKVVVIPGLALMVCAVWMFTGMDASSSTGYVIAIYIIMMLGMALVMMPAQTTGLNQLPTSLYPHGTAILNTLQQVAGAVGTALFISIMTSGSKDYMKTSSDPSSPAEAINALVSGVHGAYLIGLIIAIVALVVGLFIRRTKAPEGEGERSGFGH